MLSFFSTSLGYIQFGFFQIYLFSAMVIQRNDIGHLQPIGHLIATVSLIYPHSCLLLLTPIIDGSKPSDDTDIIIPACIKMIIDETLPRIRTLVIRGVLQFQRVCFLRIQISFSYYDFRVEIIRCMSIILLLMVVC